MDVDGATGEKLAKMKRRQLGGWVCFGWFQIFMWFEFVQILHIVLIWLVVLLFANGSGAICQGCGPQPFEDTLSIWLCWRWAVAEVRHARGCSQKEGSEGPRVVVIRRALDMIGLEENEAMITFTCVLFQQFFFTHYAVRGFESPQAWCKPFICVRECCWCCNVCGRCKSFWTDMWWFVYTNFRCIDVNSLQESFARRPHNTSADFTDPVVWHGPRCWESCNLQFKNIAPNQRVVMQDQPGWKNARKHCAGSQQEFLYCTWAACLPSTPSD